MRLLVVVDVPELNLLLPHDDLVSTTVQLLEIKHVVLVPALALTVVTQPSALSLGDMQVGVVGLDLLPAQLLRIFLLEIVDLLRIELDHPLGILALPVARVPVPNDEARILPLTDRHPAPIRRTLVPPLVENALAGVEAILYDVLEIVKPILLLVPRPGDDIDEELAELGEALVSALGVDDRLGVEDARGHLVHVAPDDIGDDGDGARTFALGHVLPLVRLVVQPSALRFEPPVAHLRHAGLQPRSSKLYSFLRFVRLRVLEVDVIPLIGTSMCVRHLLISFVYAHGALL